MAVVSKKLQQYKVKFLKLIVEIPELVAERRALVEAIAQREETRATRKQNIRENVDMRADMDEQKREKRKEHADELDKVRAQRQQKFGGPRNNLPLTPQGIAARFLFNSPPQTPRSNDVNSLSQNLAQSRLADD